MLERVTQPAFMPREKTKRVERSRQLTVHMKLTLHCERSLAVLSRRFEVAQAPSGKSEPHSHARVGGRVPDRVRSRQLDTPNGACAIVLLTFVSFLSGNSQ